MPDYHFCLFVAHSLFRFGPCTTCVLFWATRSIQTGLVISFLCSGGMGAWLWPWSVSRNPILYSQNSLSTLDDKVWLSIVIIYHLIYSTVQSPWMTPGATTPIINVVSSNPWPHLHHTMHHWNHTPTLCLLFCPWHAFWECIVGAFTQYDLGSYSWWHVSLDHYDWMAFCMSSMHACTTTHLQRCLLIVFIIILLWSFWWAIDALLLWNYVLRIYFS